MRGILTFIGGLAVGILAVTGVYAMDDDMNFEPVGHKSDELEEDECETEGEDKKEDSGDPWIVKGA